MGEESGNPVIEVDGSGATSSVNREEGDGEQASQEEGGDNEDQEEETAEQVPKCVSSCSKPMHVRCILFHSIVFIELRSGLSSVSFPDVMSPLSRQCHLGWIICSKPDLRVWYTISALHVNHCAKIFFLHSIVVAIADDVPSFSKLD